MLFSEVVSNTLKDELTNAGLEEYR